MPCGTTFCGLVDQAVARGLVMTRLLREDRALATPCPPIKEIARADTFVRRHDIVQPQLYACRMPCEVAS